MLKGSSRDRGSGTSPYGRLSSLQRERTRLKNNDVLITVEKIKKYFPVKGGLLQRTRKYVRAVDDVSLEIRKNVTLGIVGESGSGKTTLGRMILRLIDPTEGRIVFDGTEITNLNSKDLLPFRKRMHIVYQDPYTSLHPRKLVKDIVGEPLQVMYGMSTDDRLRKVKEVLWNIGLTEEHMYRYPHQFSGGQRQRIVIARSLVLNPEFMVLDEPTSALDASVQASVLNLLRSLKRRYNLTYMLISHHLSVVRYMSDYIGVMYLGKIVEMAPTQELFVRPMHPYTEALLSAIPVPQAPSRKKTRRIILEGQIPSPLNPPSGCRFHPRCPYAKERCSTEEPMLTELRPGHLVACHFPLQEATNMQIGPR